MKTLLRIENVTKMYPGANAIKALHPTSLNITEGTIHVIMGKSGSGKSTLLNILSGMDEPTKGVVHYLNRDIYKLNDKDQSLLRGKEFGYIFQFFQLIDELSVYDNICLPLLFTKQDFNKEKIRKVATELGIKEKLENFPQELSGGEQQRVAIARAIINQPKIIFADEPTANLDKTNSKRVTELLIHMCKKFNVTLVLVTHEENLISNPDYIYEMEDGNLKLR
ncbi:ABC transporter ATP-binding protein [Bacillus alkalicellulosilyticus]|uniref:ABC transporter ATP-binding protein n=1 Tax=Alkalihalobacterium alkalicellulosilyticum TaxID=1912214 RepID=UPI0009975593|nr:ABC transporter ATP-binding protein [Bacillus alkalicellulosilyticus]